MMNPPEFAQEGIDAGEEAGQFGRHAGLAADGLGRHAAHSVAQVQQARMCLPLAERLPASSERAGAELARVAAHQPLDRPVQGGAVEAGEGHRLAVQAPAQRRADQSRRP